MRKAFVFVLVFLVLRSNGSASDGDPDFSFGFGGTIITDFGAYDTLTDLTLSADGKIIAVGSSCIPPVPVCRLIVVRHNTNGTPDATFGDSGRVVIALGGNEFTTAAAQPDGKILVAGHTGGDTSDVVLYRLNNNGTPDSTFGNNGRVLTDLGGTEVPHDMALQPDGKIVVVGQGGSEPFADFVTIRYTADGSLDRTFGTNGSVSTDFLVSNDSAAAVALQTDGKVVVGGGACDAKCVFAIVRYDAAGLPDPNFGNDGIIIADLSLLTHAVESIALQPDGKILVGVGGDEMVLRLVRFLPDGRLDPAFGFEGLVAGSLSDAAALGVQSDGRIVVASMNNGFRLTRYNSDGVLDTTFGFGGQLTAALPGAGGAGSVAIQPDGRIVAGGTIFTTSNTDFVLARFSGPVVPLTLRFDPAIVRVGGVFAAVFAGTIATNDTYFDVRFRMPGSIAELESFNWQFGPQQTHGLPSGTPTGIWTITGVRPHLNLNDHTGEYTPANVNLTVIP